MKSDLSLILLLFFAAGCAESGDPINSKGLGSISISLQDQEASPKIELSNKDSIDFILSVLNDKEKEPVIFYPTHQMRLKYANGEELLIYINDKSIKYNGLTYKLKNSIINAIGIHFGHVKDSLGFDLSKITSPEKDNDQYSIRVVNFKSIPICLMHSTYINLFFDPPQRLALFKKEGETEIISLHYTAKNTSIDYEGEDQNYNAEIILPQQEIKFQVLIPHSNNKRKIVFEYILLPDLCYKDFESAIFANATTWYHRYKRNELRFDLPD